MISPRAGRRALFALLAIWFAVQLLSLNFPALSGDEASFPTVARAVWAALWRGDLQLNPVQSYSGPFELWFRGGIGAFPLFAGKVWAIRIWTWLFYLAGVGVAWKEARRRDPGLAENFALVSLGLPLLWGGARIGWAPAWTAGFAFLLWAERLRTARSGRVRFWVWGVVAGLQFSLYAPGIFAVLVAALPVLRELMAGLKRRPLAALGGALLAGALAWPVLRNIPFPEAANTAQWPAHALLSEARSFFSVLNGRRPVLYLWNRDLFPDWMLAVGTLAGLALMFWRASVWLRAPRPGGAAWLRDSAALAFVFALYYLTGHAARRLDILGNERYILGLGAAVAWLLAEAWTLWARQRVPKVLWLAPALLVVTSLLRVGDVLVREWNEPDPLIAAAEWLQRECPRESCVAYAEHFWNYWPLRYLTQDRVDLIALRYNWIPVAPVTIAGRRQAGCWFRDTPAPYTGPYRERVHFDGNRDGYMLHFAQECYLEVKGLVAAPSQTAHGP
jgi:hypothetical protein